MNDNDNDDLDLDDDDDDLDDEEEEEEEAERLCEECMEILSVAPGSEPTRLCTDCAHEIAERLTDAEAACEADKRWAESEQRWAYVRSS